LARSFADGSPKLRFAFQVTIATRDRAILCALREFLGFGAINSRPQRRPGWQPTSTLTIASARGHRVSTSVEN